MEVQNQSDILTPGRSHVIRDADALIIGFPTQLYQDELQEHIYDHH